MLLTCDPPADRQPRGCPVTFRVYGHVTEGTFDQARAAIDTVLFRLRRVESSGTVTELRPTQ